MNFHQTPEPTDSRGATSPTGHRQELLNASWPPDASTIRYSPAPIAVTARLVWATDGEEHLDTTAVRWNRCHVFIALHDLRAGGVIGTWLDHRDVRRR